MDPAIGEETVPMSLALNASLHIPEGGVGSTACFLGIELKTKGHTIVIGKDIVVVEVSEEWSAVVVKETSSGDQVHTRGNLLIDPLAGGPRHASCTVIMATLLRGKFRRARLVWVVLVTWLVKVRSGRLIGVLSNSRLVGVILLGKILLSYSRNTLFPISWLRSRLIVTLARTFRGREGCLIWDI